MSCKPLHIVTRRMPGAVENRTVRFVLSTEAEDRVGDTIAADGWKLENFLKNPVVLWCHDQDEPPIGKVIEIGVFNGQLIGDVQFASAEVNPFADTIFKLVEAGFVNAGSVGFRPVRWEFNDKGGLDFKEAELLEFSIVGVPCHPEALAQVQRSGLSLDATSRAFITETAPDVAARNEYLELARKSAAARLNIKRRALGVRANEFQLGPKA